MTIDDENSIYVGGLPYNASEEDLRKEFQFYGKIVAVKIINDREVGGKCYGFVTFTNPRSAIDAINEMDGRTIGGRVVKVNEVRTRGGRPTFNRENFHRSFRRDIDWERERERERTHFRDRDRYRDRNADRFRERDRDREYDQTRDFDRSRDHDIDRGHDLEELEHIRNQDPDLEGDHDMEWDRDREVDKDKDHDASRDGNKEQQSRNRMGTHRNDRRSRELSSDSSDGYFEEMKEQLDKLSRKREDLEDELVIIDKRVQEKEVLVAELQKKFQKIEDALSVARKLSSHRQSVLSKVHRCFMQAQDYTEKLHSSEQELKVLFERAMSEVNDDEMAGTRDSPTYANGPI